MSHGTRPERNDLLHELVSGEAHLVHGLSANYPQLRVHDGATLIFDRRSLHGPGALLHEVRRSQRMPALPLSQIRRKPGTESHEIDGPWCGRRGHLAHRHWPVVSGSAWPLPCDSA